MVVVKAWARIIYEYWLRPFGFADLKDATQRCREALEVNLDWQEAAESLAQARSINGAS